MRFPLRRCHARSGLDRRRRRAAPGRPGLVVAPADRPAGPARVRSCRRTPTRSTPSSGRSCGSAGLKPAPPADRLTLIRRVTFDLTGLPPTPGEVDAFLADHRPNAYERLVDRLLASPAYGERWARHWLDVVRYAESHGFEYDRLRDHAWRYRDYVIRSLNADKPYDAVRPRADRRRRAAGRQPGLGRRDRVARGRRRTTRPGRGRRAPIVRGKVREDELEDMIGDGRPDVPRA